MQEQFRSINRDRLSVLSGALVLALALTRFVDAPTRPLIRTTIFGSPLELNLSAAAVMLLLILGLTVTGVSSLVRSHPEAGGSGPLFMFWIVPGLLMIGVASWLDRIGSVNAWRAVWLAGAVLLPLALVTEYNAVEPAQRHAPLWQWSQTALIHLAAVILFTLIYDARSRSLLSGTAVLTVAVLLAARLFWAVGSAPADAFRYGGVVGLVLGQVTWLLNYGRLSGLQGGLLLLLLFYVLTGLIQQFLEGQFEDGPNGRRILLEYGGVAVVALLFIVLAVP
jgi:hypothetical protein